jgi:hypothetical protein
MIPPIIVDENGDVSFFETVADAEQKLESPDVLENRYVAYDSKGKLLKLEASAKPGWSKYDVTTVKISDTESEGNHVQELIVILKRYLHYRKIAPDWIQSASLTSLVAKAIELGGFTK